jgi:dihydrofolate reductase (trimethoprim resistance protein)
MTTTPEHFRFQMGDRLRKKRGSDWIGRVVGWYSTKLTPEGYAIESECHSGSVQVYPVHQLEAANGPGL